MAFLNIRTANAESSLIITLVEDEEVTFYHCATHQRRQAYTNTSSNDVRICSAELLLTLHTTRTPPTTHHSLNVQANKCYWHAPKRVSTPNCFLSASAGMAKALDLHKATSVT